MTSTKDPSGSIFPNNSLLSFILKKHPELESHEGIYNQHNIAQKQVSSKHIMGRNQYKL